ncbi:MAG: 1-acyl-sn-glycerol-3-phosphate acyltransferase [Proteobacteria bacterium]|nr:1-acyl-sn-glycerol-3-phosphate acyltransferase [Pseudomonadota bacterium]
MEGRDRLLLGLQYVLGRIAIVITAPLCFLFVRLMGYRIRDIRRIRSEVKRMYRAYDGPWIVCPNHLTMIDSLVVSYGMLSLADHILHFRRILWNLPERKNFQRNPFLALLCYLVKCLPVDRGGSREELQRLLEKCGRVLDWEQSLLVFPEGGRSRTARINQENFSYGVGRFLDEKSGCRVMLVYLRGDGQERYGTMPRFGERFTMTAEVFDPGVVDAGGLRRQREYARRIIERLAGMEGEYFAGRW